VVRDSYILAVPLQPCIQLRRDCSKSHPFSKWRGYAEIRTRRYSAFTRTDPVAIVAGRSREKFRGKLVIPHLFNRDQTRPLAVCAGRNHAFVANEKASIRACRY